MNSITPAAKFAGIGFCEVGVRVTGVKVLLNSVMPGALARPTKNGNSAAVVMNRNADRIGERLIRFMGFSWVKVMAAGRIPLPLNCLGRAEIRTKSIYLSSVKCRSPSPLFRARDAWHFESGPVASLE